MDVDKMRIGHGFDIHPFSDAADRTLVLGGVSFADHRGLVGHSDADVIAHACTDALLGPYGTDIGALFPDTDPDLAGADSVEMLHIAADRMRQAGWRPINLDCTVVLDSPKLAPERQKMQENLSVAVGAPVTIKGKRTEGVSALGEGIQCFAVGLVLSP